MFLEKFEACEKIYIQCHDNPDADTLGAGYGLYSYFRGKEKDVHMIYSGINEITKPSLRIMIESLDIPIRHVDELPEHDVLFTVDCQYAEGNVTRFPTEKAAMIDHHPCCVPLHAWCCIREEYGSCCTLVWDLLREAGYEPNQDQRVATALYYGLYSDTKELSEIYFDRDKEMRDRLVVDRELLEHMISSNLSREDLTIAGEALSDYFYDEEGRFAIVRTRSCDPNLLGVISDLVNQVATIDLCVVYNETSIGYKMSLRSSGGRYRAGSLAGYISEGIGSGGGHAHKAGGFVMKKLLRQRYPKQLFEALVRDRIRRYADSTR